jgi:hypothetical protein
MTGRLDGGRTGAVMGGMALAGADEAGGCVSGGGGVSVSGGRVGASGGIESAGLGCWVVFAAGTLSTGSAWGVDGWKMVGWGWVR